MDSIYTQHLSKLGTLIPKLSNQYETELCFRWIKRFQYAENYERPHRNAMVLMLCHQIEFNNKLSYPFTCEKNQIIPFAEINLMIDQSDGDSVTQFESNDHSDDYTDNSTINEYNNKNNIDVKSLVEIKQLKHFILELTSNLKSEKNQNEMLRMENDSLKTANYELQTKYENSLENHKKQQEYAINQLPKYKSDEQKRLQDEHKRMKMLLNKNAKFMDCFYHFQTSHLTKLYDDTIHHVLTHSQYPNDIISLVLMPLLVHMTDFNQTKIIEYEKKLENIICFKAGLSKFNLNAIDSNHSKITQTEYDQSFNMEWKYKALKMYVKNIVKQYDSLLKNLLTEQSDRKKSIVAESTDRTDTIMQINNKFEENLAKICKDLEIKFNNFFPEIHDVDKLT